MKVISDKMASLRRIGGRKKKTVPRRGVLVQKVKTGKDQKKLGGGKRGRSGTRTEALG